jgi:methionyl-tRNA formyltransferase
MAPRIPQDEAKATYFPRRSLAENEIRPEDTQETANRKIRAFTRPYRGAWVRCGEKKVVIWAGKVEE